VCGFADLSIAVDRAAATTASRSVTVDADRPRGRAVVPERGWAFDLALLPQAEARRCAYERIGNRWIAERRLQRAIAREIHGAARSAPHDLRSA
jgi:hypothetical protein